MTTTRHMDVDTHEGGTHVASSSGKPTRVLLVEDDPVSLKILKKRIASGGYEIETAIDGVEGLEKFVSFQPRMIISDWMMPRMDGRELCKAIKDLKTPDPIYYILLTARDKHEDIVQALDTGADEYIIKPCDGPELMARLRAAERMLQLQAALARSNEDLIKANERINKELQDISLIQRSLLPQALPSLPGYRFAAYYQPSTECSGDFYDLLPLGEGRLGIVIGDVSGHGAPAMVAMAVMRMLYRMESAATDDPAQCLARINHRMYDCLPTEQYVTMFYGVLDQATGRLRYSSAGHPPPLLMNCATGQASYLEGCEGFPIKLVDPNVDYDDREIVLPESHHLLFFTDGVTETFNDETELFGMDRLCRLASRLAGLPTDEVIPRLLQDLDEFRVGCPFGDDLSLMIVSRD